MTDTAGKTDEFPEPPAAWLDAVYDSASQADAYRAMEPIGGRRLAQVGGKRIHAVKFLLAVPEDAWVFTPMVDEARCAQALADHFGVSDRVRVVVCVVEQMSTADGMFDWIFVGGSVHHMQTVQAMPDMHRNLASRGAFVAVEPYRAPLYDVGTGILGKREANAHCLPLDEDRIAPFLVAFADSEIRHHDALSRYPLLALWKFGASLPLSVVWAVNRLEDRICDAVSSRLRRQGSSVCLVRRRQPGAGFSAFQVDAIPERT